MNINKYIGHESQLYGVEEHRLVGGKGDGMRLFEARNGLGLVFTVSADRCADISRLSFKGYNLGYFAACGYVAPAFYEREGNGFLKSFSAGFLATCGLTAVGSPCVDEGESLPLHGTVGNTPAERVWWEMNDDEIVIKAVVNDGSLFGRKLRLNREICCSKRENKIVLKDTIENLGDTISPLMLLYHINLGYPLLSEKSELHIPSDRVLPRNEHASKWLSEWNKMQPPKASFEERCYYHEFEGEGCAAIFNPEINKGLVIRYDRYDLDYFVEWMMMGENDYVLGLEPGNCHPDGRDKMRSEGKLKFIAPNEKKTYTLELNFIEDEAIAKL